MIPGLKKRVFNLHDVFMYVAIAQKHLRLMTLLMVFSCLCALVYYVYARPVYYAKALVRMDYVALPLDTDKVYHDGRVRVVMKELNSPHVIERTAHSLGLKGSAREVQLKTVLKQTIRSNSEKNLDLEVWPVSQELAERWPKASSIPSRNTAAKSAAAIARTSSTPTQGRSRKSPQNSASHSTTNS